jgi:hypothetical protein
MSYNKIFIKFFYNNLKIMSKVIVVILLKKRYTKIIIYIIRYLFISNKFLI